MNQCLNCNLGCRVKFCSRTCQNTYNARLRRKRISKTSYSDKCLKCNCKIQPPRRKYCSKKCKGQYLHKLSGYKYLKKYRSSCPKKFMRGLLTRADRRDTLDIDFLHSLYLKQNGKCAISGETLTYITENGKCPTNISIDRIDSSVGYEKENIQLVCAVVNTMKMHYPTEALIDWCEKIVLYNKR